MTINTPTEHENALQRIGELMEIDENKLTPAEITEADTLIDAVTKYESIHYPI